MIHYYQKNKGEIATTILVDFTNGKILTIAIGPIYSNICHEKNEETNKFAGNLLIEGFIPVEKNVFILELRGLTESLLNVNNLFPKA